MTGTALGLVALAFLLPTLCFGGGELRSISLEKKAPALLPPNPVAVERKELLRPDNTTGGLDSSFSITVLEENGTVTETNMDDYLWGVVAAEMPAAFHLEAMKAQAAAARTYTLWKSLHNSRHAQADVCTDFTCCQAWISREEAAANWGENAQLYTAKITAAISGTDGLVLCWEGQPIQAVFHSSSDGSTEDAVSVWGTTVPYLVGVNTPEGDEVPNYHTTVTLSVDETAAALAPFGCDLSGDPSTWFQAFTYSKNGAVTNAQVGGTAVSGPSLRSALNLRSASFDVEYTNESFLFSVTGYGHGVGMSQYGANAMAKEGKTWKEIVSWYYTGVTVEQWPQKEE